MTDSQPSLSYQYPASKLASRSSSLHTVLPPNDHIWAKLVPPSRHHSDYYINQHWQSKLSKVDAAETIKCPNLTKIQKTTTSPFSINKLIAAPYAQDFTILASALHPPYSSSTNNVTLTTPSIPSYPFPSALPQSTPVTSPFIIPQIGSDVTLLETYIVNPVIHGPFLGTLQGPSRSSYGKDYNQKKRKLNDLMDHLAASKASARDLAAAGHCDDFQSKVDLEPEAASSSQIFSPISENSFKTYHFSSEGNIT